MIDWGSCRSEVVPNGEGGLRFTGREICQLVNYNPYGYIFRPEPRDPLPDRECRAKDLKARRAMQNAQKRLQERPACAAAVNGPAATGDATVAAVLAPESGKYEACGGTASNTSTS